MHSHPVALKEFSPIDDAGEQLLFEFLERRTPGIIHATLLISPHATIARVLGGGQSLAVVGVGSQLIWGEKPEASDGDLAFDRQVRVSNGFKACSISRRGHSISWSRYILFAKETEELLG